jgi:hypothetical protein
MSFTCIITTIGQAKVAAAIASGVDLPLTQMAVGDGNGNPTTPSVGQTELVRERYRSSLGSVGVDANHANRVVAEMTIPATEGGWTLREVGVFDDDGDLIAVANYPDTYKPLPEEGAARDLTIRVLMQVADVSAVTLGIDPSQVFATQAWVELFYSFAAQIPGGTTHQVLRKASNADGDVEWSDPTAAVQVLVDVLKEVQTIADGQTIIDWATINTNGLALYIEGVRDEGFTPNSSTRITLDRSYPAGTKVYGYQNTPVSPTYFARKDLSNTFTQANTFNGKISAGEIDSTGTYLTLQPSASGVVLIKGQASTPVSAGEVEIGGGIIHAAGSSYVGGGLVAQGVATRPSDPHASVMCSAGKSYFDAYADGTNYAELNVRGEVIVLNPGSSAVKITGADPSYVASNQVAIGGGYIRAANGIYGFLLCALNPNGHSVRIYRSSNYADINTDDNVPLGLQLGTGAYVDIGGTSYVGLPGSGHVMIGGGGVNAAGSIGCGVDLSAGGKLYAGYSGNYGYELGGYSAGTNTDTGCITIKINGESYTINVHKV